MRWDAGFGVRTAILRDKWGMTQSIAERADMINFTLLWIWVWTDPLKKSINRGEIPVDMLDPNKTALVVVHMVKGVAGEVDTPSTEVSGAELRRKDS